MEKNNKSLYINMFLGTVGIILIGLGAIRFLIIKDDFQGYIATFIGFLIAINYINYLEQKVGISKKITWIKSAISILLFAIISYLLYL